VNAHWKRLRQPDPLESRIDIGEELGVGRVVAIGYAVADALYMAAPLDDRNFRLLGPSNVMPQPPITELRVVKRCNDDLCN